MFTIAHLTAVTDVISEKVAAEVATGSTGQARTADELDASHAKQAEVMLLLDSAISKTQALKSQLRSTNNDEAKNKASTGTTWLDQQSIAAEVADAAVTNASSVPSDPEALAKSITEGLTAKDPASINKQTTTLKSMTDSAEPIIAMFEKIRLTPGLDQYNASINTAPVVGFKDGNVMYIQAKSNRLPFGNVTNDVWSVFSQVPAGFEASKGTTHIFPYQGNIYIASGTEMWMRKCRAKGDPAVRESSSNWPKMYQDAWEKVGEQCLPANDVIDVVPWAQLSSDKEDVLKFNLVVLNADGTLQALQGENVGPQNNFRPLGYTTGGPTESPPVWTRIAYHNNVLVGYDKDYNLWDIKPDFSNNSYKIENKYAVGKHDKFTEFTANDQGLVVSKKDGFLYKRIAATVDTSNAPKDESGATASGTHWVKWIPLDGVQNLGVASPGVMLDLETLTNSLKSRYLDTQATLWPVVNNIKTFAGVHEVFLNQMNKSAKQYETSDNAKKEKLALKAGMSAVGHAKAWGKLLTTMVRNAQDPVMAMAKQLSGVSKDLEQQTALLNVKLTELKKVLEEQKKALSAANVGFWVGIGTLLVGIVGVIAGLATANPLLIFAGGALFVGGLIAAGFAGSKAERAATAVAKTETEITKVSTAIRELTAVTTDFAKINEMYGVLKMFWGRMLGECMSVTATDEALMKMIGMKLLTEDSPSYEYAMQCTAELRTGAVAYMDLLSKQGITIPIEKSEPVDSDSSSEESDGEEGAVLASLASTVKSGSKSRSGNTILVQQLTIQIANAKDALSQGSMDAYETLMVEATEATIASVASANLASVRDGSWFNIGDLKANVGVFMTAALQANLNSLGLSGGEALLKGGRAIGSLVQAQKNVVQSLQATVDLARIMSTWSDDPFSDDSEERMQQIEKYKEPALRVCHLARDAATIANNSFADINHMARESAADIQRKIQSQHDEIRMQERQMDDEFRRINVPFPLELFGSRSQIMDYVQSKAADIRRRYEGSMSVQQTLIQRYESSLNSWATCQGQSISWVRMCEVISHNLAFAQSNLNAMGKELKIDALLYRELMETQWYAIVDNASEILSIIGLPISGQREQLISKVLGFSMELVANGASGALMSIDVSPTPNLQLKNAVDSDRHLARSLNKCTSSSATFFSAMKELDILPFAADINSGTTSTNPKAMLDIVTDIRRQYSRLATANFDTVSYIQTFAHTQRFALKKLSSSTRRDVLVKQMLLLSTGATKAALRTSEAWANAEVEFEDVCSVVQSNVDIYSALMKDIDTAVAKQQKELDDYIAGITADAIAVCTVSLAVGAAIFLGPSAAWTVISKLPTLNSLQGLSWKDLFKTYYKDLDISEKAACVARLKAFKSNLDTAAVKLTSARDAFKTAVVSVQDIGMAVGRMHARLTDVSERIRNVGSVLLESQDLEELQFNWNEVVDAAEKWTDEFNRQGISPLLGQADGDVMLPLESEKDGENDDVALVNGTH